MEKIEYAQKKKIRKITKVQTEIEIYTQQLNVPNNNNNNNNDTYSRRYLSQKRKARKEIYKQRNCK